jgi:outer membrane receptor protein involved in Fe transport
VNVPKVRNYGFELESNWNPIDPLNISLTYAYLNTSVQSDDVYVDNAKLSTDPTRVRSVKGNELAQSPKHKASIQASYKFNFEDGSSLLPTVSVSWRDIFYNSFFNDAEEKSPSYFNVDSRLNWYSASGTWGLTFWVRNLLDEDQQTSASASLSSRTLLLYQNPSFSLPRTYGVDLKFHFK